MKYRFLAVIMAAFLMLPAMGVTAFALDTTGGDTEEIEVVSVSAVEEKEPNAFTPSGTGTVLDSATDADGKQFYTITTPSENIFYLIIDLERDTDNVYFLNAVTEQDLMALAVISDDSSTGESVSAIPDSTTTAPADTSGNTEPEVSPEPETEPEPERSGGSPVTMIIAVVVVLLAGGAGYYFKVYRPKQLSASEDEYEPEGGEAEDDDNPPWDDGSGDDDYDERPPWDEDDNAEDADE